MYINRLSPNVCRTPPNVSYMVRKLRLSPTICFLHERDQTMTDWVMVDLVLAGGCKFGVLTDL